MFGFAKETTRVLNGGAEGGGGGVVEKKVLENFLINKYVEQLEKLLEEKK